MSEVLRNIVHPLPTWLKQPICEVIALMIYLPMVVLVRIVKALGASSWYRLPLAYYHNKSYRVMRSDALDRFGTGYERRSTREEIRSLLEEAGLEHVVFSDKPPYWHCIAQRPRTDAE
jgi:hypothetical protein